MMDQTTGNTLKIKEQGKALLHMLFKMLLEFYTVTPSSSDQIRIG